VSAQFAGWSSADILPRLEAGHLSQAEYNACLSVAYPQKLTHADFGPGMPQGGYEAEEVRRLEHFDPRLYLDDLAALFGQMGCGVPPVRFVRHHLAHAASAYYCSGFREKALVIVADASGEVGEATTVWLGEGSTLKSLEAHRAETASLGRLYTVITEYLGFVPRSHEGHVMGSAPYGDPDRPPQPGEFIDRLPPASPLPNPTGYWLRVTPMPRRS
jgi:predicted NodU family carbamoyl transferase